MMSDPGDGFETIPAFRDELQAACSGDPAALTRFVRNYGPHVQRTVRRKMRWPLHMRFGSSDFTQMTWESVCANPACLSHCRTPDELMACLVEIARNMVLQAYRANMLVQKRDMRREQSWNAGGVAEEIECRGPAPQDAVMAKETIDELLQGQSEIVCQVFSLNLEGQTTVEIAEQLGIHERKVHGILNQLWLRAREQVARESR